MLREVYPVIPPRVDYSLTPMGVEIAGHIEVLTDWIEESLPRIVAARAQHTTRKSAPSSAGEKVESEEASPLPEATAMAESKKDLRVRRK